MKKVIILIAISLIIILVVLYSWKGRDAIQSTDNAPLTSIQMLVDSIPLGTFPYAETKEAVFRFKNTGTRPLIIKDVKTSCGCTDVTWNKKPIPPGQEETITARFTPNSLGTFSKTIEIICNTDPQKHELRLSGFVDE